MADIMNKFLYDYKYQDLTNDFTIIVRHISTGYMKSSNFWHQLTKRPLQLCKKKFVPIIV